MIATGAAIFNRTAGDRSPRPWYDGAMDCYVGLGSNLGDRPQHLDTGLRGLASAGLEPVAFSSVWETEPIDVRGGWFLNMVAGCRTSLSPREALAALQEIERRAGRRRDTDGAARTLDLDLLLFGSRTVEDADLQVPHPRMWERRFVLAPLAEIAPRLRNPSDGRTVEETLRALGSSGVVRRLASTGRLASRQRVLL